MDKFVTRSVDNNASVSQPQKKKIKYSNNRQYHEDYLKMGFSYTGALYVVKNCQMKQRCPVNLNVICLLNTHI